MNRPRWFQPEFFLGSAVAFLCVPLTYCVVTTGRVAANENDCKRHLAIIGNALNQYRDDWDNFPPTLEQLYPRYISDKSVFWCPEAGANKSDEKTQASTPFTVYHYLFQYANELKANPIPLQRGDPPNVNVDWDRAYQIRGHKLPIVMCQLHDPYLTNRVVKGEVKPFVRLVVHLDGTVAKRVIYIQRQPDKVLRWYDY